MLRRRTAIAIGTALVLAAVSLSPAPAPALKLKRAFEGPLQTQDFEGEQAFIQFKVQFGRNHKGKLVPRSYRNMRHRAVTLFCPDGTTRVLGPFQPESGKLTGFARPGFLGLGRFKKGKLVTYTKQDVDSGTPGASNDFFRLAARIPPRGPATGTFQLTYTPPGLGQRCDSGVVRFTAPRVPGFSDAP